MKDYLKLFLDSLSKWTPIKIDVHVEIKELNVGGRIYQVKGNKIELGDGNEVEFNVNKEGYPEFTYDGSGIEQYIPQNKQNIVDLDNDRKVFSRSDIGDVQLQFLTMEEKHEKIITKLKKYLDGYRSNIDMGALVAASAIIRLEDKKRSEDLIKKSMSNLGRAYRKVGRMIYNLFRSNILEEEIIPYLEKLEAQYNKEDEVRSFFLHYWYGLIEVGYPTAYFVQQWDYEAHIAKELNWRFDRKESSVRIFSRGYQRNKLTAEWCNDYCKLKKCKMQKKGPYKLGYTPGMIFIITAPLKPKQS